MTRDTQENVCEEEQFNALFRAHARDLYNFLYYKFGEENNPQDLVQEAFLKLWKHCSTVTWDKARSFLFTVANNQMLNELSKKQTALRYRQETPKSHTSETPEYIAEEKEYAERLKAAIERLSEEQRVAFLLNRIEGKKHREIAEMLGISQKAVEKRIYAALGKLRKKLGNI